MGFLHRVELLRRSGRLLGLSAAIAVGLLPGVAVSQTPRVLWEKRVTHAPGVAPTLHGDTLWIVGTDQRIQSLSASGGARHWKRSLGSQALLPVVPAPGAVAVCVGSPEPGLIVLERRNGRERWRVRMSGAAVGLAAGGGGIAVATRPGKVSAYALEDGRRLWERSLGIPIAGICQDESRLFVLGRSDSIWCLDMAEGSAHWVAATEGIHASAPVLCDSLLACAGYGGKISLFDRDGGSLVASAFGDSPMVSPPGYLAGWLGCAAVGGEIRLIELPGLSTGWGKETGETLAAGVLPWGDTWVAPCLSGRMLGFTHDRGAEAWSLDFRTRIARPPARWGPLLAAIDEKGTVTVLTIGESR
ncbi:MAG: hypothetical protein FJY88_14045 [Candidatus Eisenbacteria bacterium]|nr:hypothetical protein [Candidatus Eisenbacteria bacterium]